MVLLPKFIDKGVIIVKLTSVSKTALAAMLISGSVVTTPLVANAATEGKEQTVTAQTANGKANVKDDFKVEVANNSDGSKTVEITIPKDEATSDSSASLKNATYTAKTDSNASSAATSNSPVEVDNGNVKGDKKNADIKIELNKEALNNSDLMNDDLNITIKNSKGETIGTISNVTLNELSKVASQQKSDASENASSSSSSSSATSQASSAASSSSSSSNTSAPAASDSSSTNSSSSSAASDSSTSTDPVNSSSAKSSSANGTSTTSTSKAKQSSSSSAAQPATSSNSDESSQPAANNGSGTQNGNNAGSSKASSQSSSNAPSNGSNNGGSGSATDNSGSSGSDNSQLPQTSNDYSIAKAGVGIIGLIGSALAAFGMKKDKH